MSARTANLVSAGVAVVALAYLATMVVSGALPRQEQLIRFEARGVMQVPPEAITRVELRRGASAITLRRGGDGAWSGGDGRLLAPEAARHITMAVQMMNTSAPVKEVAESELQGMDRTPFGLDAPQVEAALYRGNAQVVKVRFGAINPEGYLQYMALAGSADLFLMSRFVGAEWAQAADTIMH